MADIGVDNRGSRAMNVSQTLLRPDPFWSPFIASLIMCSASLWPVGYAWTAESDSAAAPPEVSSAYKDEVSSEAETFRPSGVPETRGHGPGHLEAPEAKAPPHRDHIDRIKAAVSEALGEPSPSAEAAPSRRERLRELVIETPVPDILEGDQYLDELRDEVSHTIVFRPAARDSATAVDPDVEESAPEPTPGIYQVKPGDSLWKIAKDLLGDGYQWTAIYEANRDALMHKDVLSVGQRLTIPTP